MKSPKFNTFKFLQETPSFINLSLSKIESRDRTSSLDEGPRNSGRSIKLRPSNLKKNQAPSFQHEYFTNSRNIKLNPLNTSDTTPFVSSELADGLKVPEKEIKNNIMIQYHDIIHHSIYPKFKTTLAQAEAFICTVQHDKQNLLDTCEIFNQANKTQVTKSLMQHLEDCQISLEEKLDLKNYQQQIEKDGAYKIETYHSVSRERQLALELGLWMSSQMKDLKKQYKKSPSSEVFQKLHVVLTATQLQLCRQISNQMSIKKFYFLEEWAIMVEEIFLTQMKTFIKGYKLVKDTYDNQQEYEFKKLDNIHTSYQLKLDEVIANEQSSKQKIIELQENLESVQKINVYLRKKCIKLQQSNQKLIQENEIYRRDQVKLMKALEKSQNQIQDQINEDQYYYKPNSRQIKRQDTKQSEEKDKPNQDQKKIINLIKKKSRDPRDKKHPSFFVDEHIEQELFIQNNYDLSMFTGDLEDKETDVSPWLGYGIDQQEQTEQILLRGLVHDAQCQVIIDKLDNYTQCYPAVVEREQAIMNNRASYNRVGSVRLNTFFGKKQEDDDHPEIVKQRKIRRQILLANAPKIIIFEVENRFNQINQINQTETSQTQQSEDYMKLIEELKDDISELIKKVAVYDSLSNEDKQLLKMELNQINKSINQVSRILTVDKAQQLKRLNSLAVKLHETELEREHLRNQLQELQAPNTASIQSQLSIDYNQDYRDEQEEEQFDADEVFEDDPGASDTPQPDKNEADSDVKNLLTKFKNAVRLVIVQRRIKMDQKKRIQSTISKISLITSNHCAEYSSSFNKVNQMMWLIHFQNKQDLKPLDNKDTFLKVIFKKVREMFKSKKGIIIRFKIVISHSFDEFTLHVFQEMLGKNKMTESRFINFVSTVLRKEKDLQSKMFCFLISGLYSSLVSRMTILKLAYRYSSTILQQVDVSDQEIVKQFNSFVQEAAQINHLPPLELNTEALVSEIINETRDIQEKNRNKLKEIQTKKKKLQETVGDIAAIKMTINTQISGQHDLLYVLCTNCFHLLIQQHRSLREVLFYVSSDILFQTLSQEELQFILGSILFESNKISSIMKSLQTKNKRFDFVQLLEIFQKNGMFVLFQNIVNQAKSLTFTKNEFNMMEVKYYTVASISDLVSQWEDIEPIIKDRLFALKLLDKTISKVMRWIDDFCENLKRRHKKWEHGFLSPDSLIWIYNLLVNYCNMRMVEVHSQELILDEYIMLSK